MAWSYIQRVCSNLYVLTIGLCQFQGTFRLVMLAIALSGNRKSTETESKNMQKYDKVLSNWSGGDGHEMSG